MTSPRRLARTRLAGVAACVALLAACGGGGGDDDPAASDSTQPTVDVARQTELEGRLLVAADLDTGDSLDVGWEAGDVSAGVDIQLPGCVEEAAGAGAVASATAKLVQKTALHLPSLQETLSAFGSDGATTAFDAAAQRLDACTPTFVFQGVSSTGTIERMAIAAAGDRSQAWRTVVTIAGTEVSITNVHVIVGDTEVALVHVDGGRPEAAVIDGLVAKVLAKLG